MPVVVRTLNRAIKVSEERADQFARKLLLEGYKRITAKTPVDTGRAKGNWNISANRPDIGIDEEKKIDTKKGIPAPVPEDQLPPVGEDAYYITNSLPYIDVLENGGYKPGPKTTGAGYSIQAPSGMVKVTLQELTQIRRL